MKVYVLKGLAGPGVNIAPDPDNPIEWADDAEALRYIEAGIFAAAEQPKPKTKRTTRRKKAEPKN